MRSLTNYDMSCGIRQCREFGSGRPYLPHLGLRPRWSVTPTVSDRAAPQAFVHHIRLTLRLWHDTLRVRGPAALHCVVKFAGVHFSSVLADVTLTCKDGYDWPLGRK